MRIPLYQVDAFTGKVFAGNPAAVCPLEAWPEDSLMQNIAAENNLSETAFFIREGEDYRIRWMTPTVEVDLCGHATLASAFVIFRFIEPDADRIVFRSRSGDLAVVREGDLLSLDFPANRPHHQAPPKKLLDAFPAQPSEVLWNRSFVLVYGSEDAVRNMKPDIRKLQDVEAFGAIITARGNEADFVSRFFVPQVGVDEDPVTGYAHTILVPYWAERLGRSKLRALQVSRRGGELFCEDRGDRVKIAGRAVLYLQGHIEI